MCLVQRMCLAVLAVLYFGWCFAHLAYLIHLQHGIGHVIFVLLLTELNDIAAFCIGKAIEKHPLSPRISPNKTIEGSLGALVAVLGCAGLFRFAVSEFSTTHLWLVAGLISLTGTFATSPFPASSATWASRTWGD